jgi:hypothetical protein
MRLLRFAAASAATLALGLGPAACSSTMPDTVPPPVPQITAPTDGQVFGNFPRTTTVTWTAVSDASSNPVTYRLDIQVLLPDGTVVENLTDENDAGTCNGSVTATTCQFDFTGKNPGRLRIQAVDKAGNASAFSAFVNFNYTV